MCDEILFVDLTPYGDHDHLIWRCPDCGSEGLLGGVTLYRWVCARTGRRFLVIGLPPMEPIFMGAQPPFERPIIGKKREIWDNAGNGIQLRRMRRSAR
jgi:hypothetical protein